MTLLDYKKEIIYLSNYHAQLMTGSQAETVELVRELCGWLLEKLEKFYSNQGFLNLYQLMMELAPLLDSPDQQAVLHRRCRLELAPPLYQLARDLQLSISINVYLSPAVSHYADCFCKPGTTKVRFFHMKNEHRYPFQETDIIPHLSVLVCEETGSANNFSDQPFDRTVSFGDLLNQSIRRSPVDMFLYDRLFLEGKLNALRNRPDIRVWVTGSSYAMVGIQESAMPHPALNGAINAQDLYYSLLNAKRALSLCPGIQTVIMPLAYYFFFSDMADHPSDYMLSVLSRVNYPVFGDLHGYPGELKPEYPEPGPLDPVLDSIYQVDRIRDMVYRSISGELSQLSYYNAKFNPRPAGGMLSYCFRDRSDQQNRASAKVRAGAHNKLYDLDHGRNNIKLLDEFLDEMESGQRQVILFVPPVTEFYRAAVSKEMQSEFYRLVRPVVEKHPCVFLDLFDSALFTREDFQDYDHLNAMGADKLSRMIAEHCRK